MVDSLSSNLNFVESMNPTLYTQKVIGKKGTFFRKLLKGSMNNELYHDRLYVYIYNLWEMKIAPDHNMIFNRKLSGHLNTEFGFGFVYIKCNK